MKQVLFAFSILALGLSASAKAVRTTETQYTRTTSVYGGGLQEIQVGAGGGGSLSTVQIGDSTYTSMGLRGSYLYLFDTQIQAGGELIYSSLSGNGLSQSGLSLVAEGVWNFDSNLDEAFYAKGGLGTFAVINNEGKYDSKFGFFVGAGKRFPISGLVHYEPEFRLYEKGSNSTFELLFLNLSLIF